MIRNKKILIGVLLLLLITLAIKFRDRNNTQWHMLNVSYERFQGDAHVLINDDTVTIIDAGLYAEANVMVVPFLKKKGIDVIDYFFISHAHADHYEGMEAIQQAGIEIRNVYYSLPPGDVSDCCYSEAEFQKYLNAAQQRGAQLHNIETGFTLEYPNKANLEVLYVQSQNQLNGNTVDLNDMSLIMKWTAGKYSVLFTGDLNVTVGHYLANDPRMKADILKVPHHGSSSIAPNAFFEKVDPILAMIPSQKHNWLSDRSEQARSWVQTKELPYCVSGINGNISITLKDQVMISPQHPSKQCRPSNIIK